MLSCHRLLNFHLQETDVIVSQVLDELGISLDHELSEITPGLDKPHVMNAGGPVCACVHHMTQLLMSVPCTALLRELLLG